MIRWRQALAWLSMQIATEFDSEHSVDMVHYEELESGDNSGYKLIVFGRRGIIETRYGGYSRGN